MKQLFKICCILAALQAPSLLSAQTMLINTVAGNGTNGFSGDGGPATAAQFFNPYDVACDAAGNLYVADNRNHRIRKIHAATGIINTIAGQGAQAFGGDGGPATAAYLSYPTEVKLDGAGNIYITDQLNYRIRKITVATGIITTIVGGGSSTYSSGMPATSLGASFRPAGLGVDPAGNCYFMDSFPRPRIVRYDALSGNLSTVINSSGAIGFSGDGGLAVDATMDNLNYYPGISAATDAAGNLYVTDVYNFRVRKVDNATGIITTIGGDGSTGPSGDGGPATAAGLGLTFRIALDNADNVYFFSNLGLHKIDAATQTVKHLGGGGSSYAEGIPATAAKFYSPMGVAVDAAQNVYYVDYDGRVRKLTPGCSSVSAGTIGSSAGNSFCDSARTTLSLFGVTGGQDIAYQWQSSANGTTWANAGTDSLFYVPATIYSTTYYRAIVTCTSAGIADTTPVDTVTILPAAMCITGIATTSASGDIKVYPNPNTGSFNIEVASAASGLVQVSVTNMLGVRMKTFTVATNSNTAVQLDVPAGIYFLNTESPYDRKALMIVVTR